MNIGRRRHTDRRRGEDRAIPARHGISRPHVRIPDDPQRSSGYRTLGLGLALEVWAEGPVSGTERTSYAYREGAVLATYAHDATVNAQVVFGTGAVLPPWCHVSHPSPP